MHRRVLFIVPYPTGKAPSQRFRFEQYITDLNNRGISCTTIPFLDESTWEILYLEGRYLVKALSIIKGLFKRFFLLFGLSSYDYIFIHREASPIGPPFFEFISSKLLGKKIIYDFDDAIWIPNFSEANSFFSFLKGYRNVKHICKWAYRISCGNNFLCEYALQYNSNVVYNPTTIDTIHHHNIMQEHKNALLVIGWTGSHSTIRYLYKLIPILSRLEKEFRFEFRVISDIEPEIELNSFRFKKWNKSTEIEDLSAFNIGIMPLEDDKWAKGKCGFKALQYMALGIPAVVSPVGVNMQIVDDGINGFICSTDEEWETAFRKLLVNRELLQRMGAETRSKIEQNYSVKSNAENVASLFK